MSLIKRMSITEFRETGYLQEVNRKFLHPLGLALEAVIEEDGSEHLGGVWDYRDDPEGIVYGVVDDEKVKRVHHLEEERKPVREKAVGYWIQSVDE